MSDPLVIYHGGGCRDGWCAAWILDRVIGPAELVPAQYGDEPPIVDGRDVYVVDFSYSVEQMIEMHKYAHSLIVLDHHKTAKEQCQDLKFCVFDENRSGATMALWLMESRGLLDQFANPKDFAGRNKRAIAAGMRSLSAYVEDRDLWRHQLPDTTLVNTVVRVTPFELKEWDMLAERLQIGMGIVASEGAAINRYRNMLIDEHVKHCRWIQIGGYRVKAVECTASEVASEIIQTLAEGEPFAAQYFMVDGGVVFSLRSSETGIDVSEIAKMYGGGGHKHAAGFRMPLEPIDKLVDLEL